MTKLEENLEALAMHYAGKSGRLMGVINSIETTLKTYSTDTEWAIKTIQSCIERAKEIE